MKNNLKEFLEGIHRNKGDFYENFNDRYMASGIMK
jgi:hypothetical protein